MPKTGHEPARTCVACRQRGDRPRGGSAEHGRKGGTPPSDQAGKRVLVRFTRNADGVVVEDPTGRAPGRGAYLHDDPECRALALKKRSLERALKLQNRQKGDNP